MPLIEQLVGALTQHIQGDRLVNASLESFVGALAGVHLAVHFLCDVYPELQRRDRTAPEARLGRVINACVCGCRECWDARYQYTKWQMRGIPVGGHGIGQRRNGRNFSDWQANRMLSWKRLAPTKCTTGAGKSMENAEWRIPNCDGQTSNC